MSLAFTLMALTTFMGGGVLLLNGIAVYRYMREWRRTPGRPGLLPLHVWTIASSYFLLVLLLTVGTITGYTDVMDWRSFFRIPALAFGLVAMFVLVNFQTKTYSHTRRRHEELRDAAQRSSGEHRGEPDGR